MGKICCAFYVDVFHYTESQEDFFKVGIYVVAAGALFAVVMVLAVIGVLLCRYKDTREWKH